MLIWHGKIPRVMQIVGDLEGDLGDNVDIDDPGPEHTKLLKEVKFGAYINDNTGSIPNDRQWLRAGETISTAFVESTVSQVISKRMVKRQQMRWTPAGAHLLLQIRTRVLNDEIADDFQRWYPGFTHTAEHHDIAA